MPKKEGAETFPFLHFFPRLFIIYRFVEILSDIPLLS